MLFCFENHLMVPISPKMADRIRRSVLERMTCNGQLLMDLVRRQKYDEEESLKTWKLPVQIVTPVIAVCILLLIVYAIRQRTKYLRMWDRNDWNINFVVPNEYFQTLSNHRADKEWSTQTPQNDDIHKVVTRPLSIAAVFGVNRKVKQTLVRMRDEIVHENVARFFGISSRDDAIYLVEQYCSNGTLVDFLRDNQHVVNQSICYVVCADIANGMTYLHRQNVIHGNLTVDKCHVDSHLTIKIVDWEYTALYDVIRQSECNRTKATREKSVLHFIYSEAHDSDDDPSPAFRHLAPELQKDGRLSDPTRAGDVYSFGVIVGDLFFNSSGQDLQPASAEAYSNMPTMARQIMKLACAKVAIKRPTFDQVEKSMRSAVDGGNSSLLDRCVNYVKVCLLSLG